MSTTSVRPAGLPLAAGPSGTRLPTTRTRRPTFAALAVLLILVGALASAWLVYRSGNRVDVLVARGDIEAGHVMTEEDFSVARVATDDAPVIIASAQDNFIGTHAASAIPEGTLLNRDMFLAGDVVPEDGVVVGMVLTPQQRPASNVKPGDVVRLILVPPTEAGGLAEGQPGQLVVSAVRVVEVGPASEGSQGLAISVLTKSGDAGRVVAAASAGQLAVARLAAETEPTIDLVRE
jgi:hypothetical protein